ncbi:hypothetical protein CYLTODRAFT_441963 [Cylindrobasidium torrendii FP15055 ss-10]|uniref:Uncharacterized protein n=1 Tax=Cylindrobasidium torrendii FP15055 ss-10 TaxID=1314674 RepID=A0A0D7BJ71_9AGAR|nr:hypothetical protein CYLTODRAFT_441963 [Cylindrobasidium torrendii FP15055 ss-10]
MIEKNELSISSLWTWLFVFCEQWTHCTENSERQVAGFWNADTYFRIRNKRERPSCDRSVKEEKKGMDTRLVPTTLVVKYPDVRLLHKQNILKGSSDRMNITADRYHPSLQYEPFFQGTLSSFNNRVEANHDLATAHLILAILKSSVASAPSIEFDIVCETTEVQRHSLDTKYDLAHIPYIDISCLFATYPILWKILECHVKHCYFSIRQFGSSNIRALWDAYRHTQKSEVAGADEWSEFDSPFTDSCGWHGKDGWLQSRESRHASKRGRIPLTEAVWSKIVSIVISCRRPFKHERRAQSQERFAAFVAKRSKGGGVDDEHEEETSGVKYEKIPPKKVISLRDRLKTVMQWEPILRNNEPRQKDERSKWIAERADTGGHRFWMMEMLTHGMYQSERSLPEKRAMAYKRLVEVACDNAMAVRGRGSAKKYLEAKKIMDGILPLNERRSNGKAALRRRMFTELWAIYSPQPKSALSQGWTEF